MEASGVGGLFGAASASSRSGPVPNGPDAALPSDCRVRGQDGPVDEEFSDALGVAPEPRGCPPGPVEEKRYPAGGCWPWDGHTHVVGFALWILRAEDGGFL